MINYNNIHSRSMKVCERAMEGGSELQNPEPTISSSIIASRLEALASTFHLTNHQPYIGFQQYEIDVATKSTTSCSSEQSSADKCAVNISASEQDTLQSVVTPHLSSMDCGGCFKLNESSCGNFMGSVPVLQVQKKLFKTLPTSSDTMQKHKSCLNEKEKQLCGFLTGPCACAFSRPSRILSCNKKRIKWTQDLHKQFVECVNRLGGAEKATPKAVLKLMKSSELTIYQVQSHLQKYRSEKYELETLEGKPDKGVFVSDIPQLSMKISKQLREVLQMQLDVQKHLQYQLEIQQNLQMLIEEQEKQVKIMLEKQQKKRIEST